MHSWRSLRGFRSWQVRREIIFPAHPRTRSRIHEHGLEAYFRFESQQDSHRASGIRLIDPKGYLDFVCLMKNARLIVTDSGGIQEESICLGVPCVTLRENTEAGELAAGMNALGGVQREGIQRAVRQQLVRKQSTQMPEMWDGKAAERIVEVLASSLHWAAIAFARSRVRPRRLQGTEMSTLQEATVDCKSTASMRSAATAQERQSPLSAARTTVRGKIWIDLDNSPHVPFFKPIAEELERRGYSVIFTARDCFQVRELADLMKLNYRCIGHHYGKHTVAKLAGIVVRALQLLPYVLRQRPQLAVSHGSRSMFALASMLRIPTITIMDYEHARWAWFLGNAWAMLPTSFRGPR